MIVPTYILIYFLIIIQLHSNIVLSQRVFVNPAINDPAACTCDLRANSCDPNCCCDSDCSNADLSVSPICNSIRTTPVSSDIEQSLQTWKCSNTTSAALYDYFPFVCVQFELNEVIGPSYPYLNKVAFINTIDGATNLRSTFVAGYPELFQSTSLSSSSSFNGNYFIGAPVYQSITTVFTLPGNLVGSVCQENVQVLFGINRDVSCISNSLSQDLCTRANSVTSILKGGDTSSTITINFFTKTYIAPITTTRDFVTEYFFQDSYSPNINNISYTNGPINDYCLGYYPITRTQRYSSACISSNTSTCSDYQVWSGCQLRDTLQYSTIPDTFFTARVASTDDSTNFADFNGATNGTSISCTSNDTRRVFYRINYSSLDNTISTIDVFALLQSSPTNARITIEWNDIATSTSSASTFPRGYLLGEALQFQRNNNVSDVSTLVPTSSGLCIDATRQSLSYKKSTSSYCFIQLTESTIKQCHNLKLNMYLYLNAFYAPASDVLAYPNSNATLVQIRDTTQDSIDLDRIDETRLNNRLSTDYISQTSFGAVTYRIYDTTGVLPVCYNVPSGVYIEFSYIRVNISSTLSYERIVSVQYNYTYSNWQFDCTAGSCSSTSTQRYLVSFQSAFTDVTNQVFNLGSTTRADITSADNYIQHLLWLISPEYNGEPGYRKYTIAMILIFIAICVVVMHVLLFGIMCPF